MIMLHSVNPGCSNLRGTDAVSVGTNDCYATMHLGKDKYHTSIKEKSKDPEWQEECDL